MCFVLRCVRKISEQQPLATSCLFVRPSVRMEQLCSHWANCHEIWYLSIFRKFVYNIQILLKSDKINRYFTWRPMKVFLQYLAGFFLEQEMFDTNLQRKTKTNLILNHFFWGGGRRKSCHLWDNVAKQWSQYRPHTAKWRMRIACWVPRTVNKHTRRLCDTHCFPSTTAVVRTRLNSTVYVLWLYLSLHILSKPFFSP